MLTNSKTGASGCRMNQMNGSTARSMGVDFGPSFVGLALSLGAGGGKKQEMVVSIFRMLAGSNHVQVMRKSPCARTFAVFSLQSRNLQEI